MRALLQRVERAMVMVDGAAIGTIGRGLLVFVGVGKNEESMDVEYLAGKIHSLRIFPDGTGKMNLDIGQAGGGVLIVSSFTLYADARQGRRPGFGAAAPPDIGERLIEELCIRLSGLGLPVQTGRFGAMMSITAVHDGPINILLDSRKAF